MAGLAYQPSASSRLLFVGPFRYRPNRDGIVRFLREAWPAVRAAVPEATLTILGGDESAGAVREEPAFAQPGVEVLGHRDDVPRLLAASALAVNPLAGIRGSAIKLVETLAAGRVCVTTEDGARGFTSKAPPALVIVVCRRRHGGADRAAAAGPGSPASHRIAGRRRAGCVRMASFRCAPARAVRGASPLTMAGTYDRIARFYDVDMGQNMRFDDVAFYADRCERQRGAVLELGCGNGRVLLPLLARGLDAVGVDASAPMLGELSRKAVKASLPVRAIRADARRLPLRPGFATVLCPYSLVTYMTTRDDVNALLAGARAVLAPRGLLVIDAFVPRPVAAQREHALDYRRPFGAFTLVRSKRVTPLPDGINRIERRYELAAHDGRIVETVEVAEPSVPARPRTCAAPYRRRVFPGRRGVGLRHAAGSRRRAVLHAGRAQT